ncbi:MAG: hypothetical protein KIT39_10930 [Nitrospirales bacterium]|nr:hypothetical protein [Nitrospirales bacterium]
MRKNPHESTQSGKRDTGRAMRQRLSFLDKVSWATSGIWSTGHCGLAMLAVAVPTAAQDRAPQTLFINVHIFDGLSAVTARDRD